MALKIGLEALAENPAIAKEWGNCGLASNQASVTLAFEPSWKVIRQVLGERLRCLFGPQHGMESSVQDNMIETGHAIHPPSGLKLYSLYSETREPTEEMLSGIDTLIIDLPITGTRIYTYKYTMAACMRAARKTGKRVVVLDRPNPLGGVVIEGPVLQQENRSFVGEFSIPVRHGMTMGEAAQFFNQEIGCQLEIVKLIDWNPALMWHQLGRPWVLTSPNLPTCNSCYVFPGGVLWEGANFSEGRGTTLPFQFVGAPYVKSAEEFAARVQELVGESSPGLHLRPAGFQPCFQKWANNFCRGFQIHIIEASIVRSFSLGIATIRAAAEFGGDSFGWKQPPYEYEYERAPMDLILGLSNAQSLLLATNFNVTDSVWHSGQQAYLGELESILLYDRPNGFILTANDG